KSATTVGNVLGRYHPHGDAAVYGTMVRMAQPFSYRYTLVEGHGNFGSVDGDPPAAYRYTEARMSKIAAELMEGIEKNAVRMTANFDNQREEPTVLPARFPNLLVNGAVGIAVGMATNIPTHNLGEVIDATLYRMDHPECEVEELMQYIKGPDFPTAARIYGTAGIKKAYATGAGRIAVRARAEIDEENRQILITEIPYMVNKSLLVESIGQLHKEKRVDGITDLRDESGKDGMKIVIEYRRDVNGEILLNQLYKFTQLQDTCSINMLALVNGEPKVLPLASILDHYIVHQKDVIYRRTQYDLDKALARMHIYEGYKIALDNIDEIVQLMKTSPSIPESKARLSERYGLTDAQAQAIVEMTLGRLTGMEREKIEEELARLTALVADLRDILSSEERVKQIIREEMTVIRDKYGDERRTEILEAEDEIDLEDLIERHNCIITVSHAGYVKRQASDVYSAQNRGGKGIIGVTTKEEDFIETVLSVCSHDILLLFTNFGKVYARKAYLIPEASRTSKGSNIVNIVELAEGEKLTGMIAVSDFPEDEYLTMVTKLGVIKKTPLSDFEYNRKGGKKAIELDEGDELYFVRKTDGQNSILIATEEGQSVRFDENNVRSMGRGARGVRAILLKDEDKVTGVAVVDESKKLLTITENGFGKKTEFEDFREMKNRGGMGVTCHKLTEKTGKLVGIATVGEDEDIMLISHGGTIIRVRAADISTYSRTASGVTVMRTREDAVVSFTVVPKEEDEETQE
ncbi:MAG: DNA gyrase subunit A, partial [Ruminococcaceae bacterium]|nr:DNA gyrase subunit A [Oscillospiraceae bacterium]